MVALTSCAGDIEAAARAVASAAADGDLSAFGAGLSVGMAVLAGVNVCVCVCAQCAAGRRACQMPCFGPCCLAPIPQSTQARN